MHEPAFGKAGVVYEVGVDGVLQIAASVVWEEDVDCFGGAGIAYARDFGRRVVLDGMVDGGYDVGVRREQGIGFYFFEGLGDGFLAKRAADLLEGV